MLPKGMRIDTELGRLRIVSLLEGVSYLLLLGIAVPLKYVAGAPLAVQVLGRVHGLLFVLFVLALAQVAVAVPWTWRRVVNAIVLAVLPFGAFVFEARLRAEEDRRPDS
jgi:integral membrane protein